ncbi:MAG: hydroxymyristoyl-ACP dehydratase [Burkholderiales bacterium]
MRSPDRLDRDAIAALIPHQGAMCLLDAIDAWSRDEIYARAVSHRQPGNPLRERGALPAIAAIEYAAQAMAAHGSLLAREDGTVARPGYLVAVRDVQVGVRQLDRIEADLEVRATRLAGDAGSLMYAFVVTAEQKIVLTGRAIVTLERAAEGGR